MPILTYNKTQIETWRKELTQFQKNPIPFPERITLLVTHLQNSTLFLNQIAKNPEQLVYIWISSIQDQINRHRQIHKITPPVSVYLANLEEKLAAIISIPTSPTPPPSYSAASAESLYPPTSIAPPADTNVTPWHFKYLLVAGFLWELRDLSVNDPQLLTLIDRLLEQGHIDRNADLPDELATGRSCSDHFVMLKSTYRDLFILPKVKTDEELYDEAMQQLLSFAYRGNQGIQMHDLARNLVTAIQDEIVQTKKRREKPNRALYAEVASLALLLANHEASDEQTLRFANLINIVAGQSSTAMKVAGIMTGILALTTLLFTFGGICISIIANSFAVAFNSMTPAAADQEVMNIGIIGGLATSALGYTGLRLFSNAKQQGVSLAMENLYKESCNRPF